MKAHCLAVRLCIGCLLLFGGFFPLISFAQENVEITPEPVDLLGDFINAAFVVENDAPLTGEPVDFTLVVEIPDHIEVVSWPEFPETWSDFIVLQVNERETEAGKDGHTIYRQSLTALIWVSGEHETPETLIGYRFLDEDDETEYFVPVNPGVFHVPSALETRDLNVLVRKPDRSPISFFYLPLWLTGLITLVLVGGVWGWLRWLERRRMALAAQMAAMANNPRDVALAKFAQIRSGRPSPETVFTGVSATLRTYIEQCFAIPASEMTTHELLTTLKRIDETEAALSLDEPHLSDLERLLKQADLVKFADLHPAKRAAGGMLKIAEQWILAVDRVKDPVTEENEEYVE